MINKLFTQKIWFLFTVQVLLLFAGSTSVLAEENISDAASIQTVTPEMEEYADYNVYDYNSTDFKYIEVQVEGGTRQTVYYAVDNPTGEFPTMSTHVSPYVNEHIYFNTTTKTLTLNNAEHISIYAYGYANSPEPFDFSINLIGENTIIADDFRGDFDIRGATVTITGTGSLVLGDYAVGGGGYTVGLCDLIINSGTIEYTHSLSLGSLTMNGGNLNGYCTKNYIGEVIINGGSIDSDACTWVTNNFQFNGGYFKSSRWISTNIDSYVKPDTFNIASNTTMYCGYNELGKTLSSSYSGQNYIELLAPSVMNSNLAYQTHVQNIGWQGWKNAGDVSGTDGCGLRLESIIINTRNIDVGIRYRTHVQNLGWQNYVSGGEMSGTSGQGLRLEAIQIETTGANADQYDIYYQVHAQNIGWLGWAKNGEEAGTAGYGYRLEGIRIMIVPKGEKIPEDSGLACFFVTE